LSAEPTLAELLEVQAYFRLPSPALVEKDFYVVKALAAIAAVDKEALHVRLVFGGGTALSRAHRLIKRMSEDIDLRIVVDSNRPGRGTLRRLRARITEALLGAGFKFDPEDTAHRKTGNETRYTIWGRGPCARRSRSKRRCGRIPPGRRAAGNLVRRRGAAAAARSRDDRVRVDPRTRDPQENVMKPEILETRLLKRIDRKRGDVFLRADFGDPVPTRAAAAGVSGTRTLSYQVGPSHRCRRAPGRLRRVFGCVLLLALRDHDRRVSRYFSAFDIAFASSLRVGRDGQTSGDNHYGYNC
jgi:hypothetical protein